MRRIFVFVVCCGPAWGDVSFPRQALEWPKLRRALARYCEEHDDRSCEGARALMARAPDQWTEVHPDGEGMTIDVGRDCYAYHVSFGAGGRVLSIGYWESDGNTC
jgi:hypothetical protein